MRERLWLIEVRNLCLVEPADYGTQQTLLKLMTSNLGLLIDDLAHVMSGRKVARRHDKLQPNNQSAGMDLILHIALSQTQLKKQLWQKTRLSHNFMTHALTSRPMSILLSSSMLYLMQQDTQVTQPKCIC